MASTTSSTLLDQIETLITFVDKYAAIEAQQSTRRRSSSSNSWAVDPNKKKTDFRNYGNNPNKPGVDKFYKEQHEKQTFEYVMRQRQNWLKFDKCVMTIWDMLHYLANVVDESDPDTDLSQLDHALQTAEASRAAYPGDEYDWLHVAALIHDLGKVMAVKDEKLGFQGEPQWGVVGDIFPVGCRFSEKCIYHEFFAKNPDSKDARYNSKYGVYSEKCGLENVYLCWSHDEYMYNIAKQQSSLPYEALCMLRYHSFYPWHGAQDYMYLCNDKDLNVALKWVRIFNDFDLYSKSDEPPDFDEVGPYYKQKLEKYFPKPVRW